MSHAGHGTKGKKRWLTDIEDIDEMKKLYVKKKEVLLWCYDPSITPTKKRSSTQRQIDCDDSAESTKGTPKPKSRSRFESALENKMSKVEEVYETLQKKHSKVYKPEQLRAWANMVQMQKHTSLKEPPSGRFFKTHKSTNQEPTLETSVTTECKAPLSPAEKLALRTQCIEQLEQWHGLMEKGAISQEQYTDIQARVLDEMKNY